MNEETTSKATRKTLVQDLITVGDKLYRTMTPVIHRGIYERDAANLAQALSENKIPMVYYTSECSNYLQSLMILQDCGYHLDGMVLLEEQRIHRYGETKSFFVPALRLVYKG